jgi:peroxin-19
MLDEFSPAPSTAKPALPTGPGRPSASKPDLPIEEGLSDDEFAKQLQSGMAELLGELETSPDMQAQFESMLKELGGAAALGEAAGLGGPGATASKSKEPTVEAGPSTAKAEPAAAVPGTEESFQETIKKTMERMRESGDQATAAATSDNTDDLLAEMMKAMQAGGLDGEGGEEDFSKMLLGMMEQLTNKEILYEPMKELDDKFPDWMKKNAGKVNEADLKRYKEQQIYVREIVKRFESKTYKDENTADREYIVDRMQKVGADLICIYFVLMYYRCKQLALPLLISWEICKQHKKLSGLQKKVALHNEDSSTPNYSNSCPFPWHNHNAISYPSVDAQTVTPALNNNPEQY